MGNLLFWFGSPGKKVGTLYVHPGTAPQEYLPVAARLPAFPLESPGTNVIRDFQV
jgi:hypothetical protein